jgi:hypothetical protein
LDVKFEGRRLAKIWLKTRQLVCLFLILTSALLSLSFFYGTRAEMVFFSITPDTGYVGTNVTLTANLTTSNGRYNVTFDGVFQGFDYAVGNNVSTSFEVPEATFGSHNVTVVDATTGDNVIGVFTVSTAYLVNATVPDSPRQLQEGDSVPISLKVTGGNATSSLNVTVTVQTPPNINYNKELNVSISNLGSGNAILMFPADFSSNANTSYVGSYNVSLDVSTAESTFFMGLTNSTEYHRNQAVNIRALYAPDENVTLTVSGNNVQDAVNLTADSEGVIDYSNWTVPANAIAQTQYNVSIVSVSGQTSKTPADTQNFTVLGFAFNVTARNLAEETVSGVVVEAFENELSVNNQTTDSAGLAVLMVEIGNYTLQAYYDSTKVGESVTPYSVTDTVAVDIICNLTNLNVRVFADLNGVETGIPEVAVNLTPGDMSLATDITGNAVAHSLLPNIAYSLTSSRYDTPFNATSIADLLGVNGSPVDVFYVNITCPSFGLRVDAFKADRQPFGSALVEIKELSGGINYAGTTDLNGTVTFPNATFGRYDVGVYSSTGQELNSTTVDVFQDQNVTVYCNLFGLNISVKVVDYFGQPFADANVTLQGNGSKLVSERTQSNGVATFENLVGDSFSVSVYMSDKGLPTIVKSLTVDGSTTVSIAIDKYVLLAGFPIETSQLAIAIIIVLTLLLILSIEVYRKRRSRSKKIDG